MFFLRLPDGFTPEDHGWIRADAQMPNPVPDTYTGEDGDKLFGMWLRHRIPFRYPECLNVFLYAPDSGARGAWFGPQPDIPDEEVPLGALWGWLRGERDTRTELCT